MHAGNQHWWNLCKRTYPDAFVGKRVLEVGSYNINGTIRDFFTGCDYTGVDFRPGPLVDVVCLAHDMDFPEPFDVVVSGQMLEHDPYWDRSINKMIDLLKPDGLLFLSWGPAHAHTETGDWAPDGAFHPLPARKVVDLVRSRGLNIQMACYESQIPGAPANGDNYFVVVAGKPQTRLSEETLVGSYLAADDVPWPS